MFLTKWPKDEENTSPVWSALIPISESPSNWHCCRPIFEAKITARLAAIISKLSTLCGFRIFPTIAAKTWPEKSRTTIPIPASSLSLNVAPLKFFLYSPSSSGSHLHLQVWFPLQGSSRLDRNCCRNFFAAYPMLPSCNIFSISLVLFRCVQMNHAVVANNLVTLG